MCGSMRKVPSSSAGGNGLFRIGRSRKLLLSENTRLLRVVGESGGDCRKRNSETRDHGPWKSEVPPLYLMVETPSCLCVAGQARGQDSDARNKSVENGT